MDDDPLKIAKAIRISRKCIRIVYENIAFALIVKAPCACCWWPWARPICGPPSSATWA